jgi:calcium homeostasis endoplasmic reticulum protein
VYTCLDQVVAERIQKLANYVARNGPNFEEIIKQKEQTNAKFAFLFGGENYPYYR